MFPQTSVRENLGQWVGKAASPLMSLSNTIREAGILPGGISFYANVIPARHAPSTLQTLAQRLSGKGLVRLAPGLWKEEHSMLPDVLSCSVRFHVSPPMEEPAADAQDLILVSARSPWTFAVDSVKTDQSNYLLNKYYGLWPFEIDGIPDFQIRVSPNTKPMEGSDRNERMRRCVEHGGVDLVLEICGASTSNQWTPLVELRLEQEVEIDEAKVNFWPFHNGLGFKPEGLMNYLRPMPSKLTSLARQSLSEAAGSITKTGQAASETTAKVTDRAATTAGKTAAKAQATTASVADQARETAEESAQKARGIASKALHRVSSTVNEVSTRAREVASSATSKAADIVSEMRGKTRRAVHDMEDQATKALNGAASTARAVTGRTRKAAKQAGDQAAQTAQKATRKAQDSAARTARAVGEAKNTLHDVSDRVAKGASRAANEAGDAASDISKRATKAAKRTADETASTATDVKQRVQEGNNSKH